MDGEKNMHIHKNDIIFTGLVSGKNEFGSWIKLNTYSIVKLFKTIKLYTIANYAILKFLQRIKTKKYYKD